MTPFRALIKDMATVVTWYAAGAVYIGIFMQVYECGNRRLPWWLHQTSLLLG